MAEGKGGERKAGGVRLSAALAAAISFASPVNAQQAIEPANAIPADAKRIVTAFGMESQFQFAARVLAPIFAVQMMATLSVSDRFKAQMAKPSGREELEAVVRQEFEKAFQTHMGEIIAAIAKDYAARLSPADLKAVADFVGTGPGARWAAISGAIQQSGSAVGAKVGAAAGEEAYDAVLKRLDPHTGLIK